MSPSARRTPVPGRRPLRAGARLATLLLPLAMACDGSEREAAPAPRAESPAAAPAPPAGPDRAALAEQARQLFGPLPAEVTTPDNPITPEKIALGRMLYYDARFSKNQDISCNSCHGLDAFGVDHEPTSPGHRGQRGDRNSPSVYNAALHVAQFWDGRAANVEEQAKGPVLNPVEMAMPSEDHVLRVLRSIPGYRDAFAKAFPDAEEPIHYDHFARAVGAFERRLTTPGRFDAFLNGEADALSDAELAGLQTFIETGCATCHLGPAVGGTLYRKLGQVVPYETGDPGREKVTGDPADRHVFKVPSLRNIEKTGPWFHDGSIESLPEAIRLMAKHQLGRTLEAAEVERIATFLRSLTGRVNAAYVARPELPASGPNTPPPDPS